MCWLSPGSEILHPRPSVSQTQQSKSCRKKVPSNHTDSCPWARGQTWETVCRWTTQIFPGCVLLTLQLHVQPWARHSKGHPVPRVQPGKRQQCISGPQLLLQKGLLLLNPNAAMCFQANNWWVSNGLWLLRFQDKQPSSVLLPDLFLGPGKIVPCSSSDWKETASPWGLSSSWQSKRVTTRWFWEAFAKNFQWKGSYFFLQQGGRQERNPVLEQINPCAVPRLTWSLGRTTHLQLGHRPYRGTPSIPPPLVEGGQMGLWGEHNNSSASPQKLSPHLHKSTHCPPTGTPQKLLSTQGSDSPNALSSVGSSAAAARSRANLPALSPAPVEHHLFSQMHLLESDWEATILEGVETKR